MLVRIILTKMLMKTNNGIGDMFVRIVLMTALKWKTAI